MWGIGLLISEYLERHESGTGPDSTPERPGSGGWVTHSKTRLHHSAQRAFVMSG